jgi:hypothetical protein
MIMEFTNMKLKHSFLAFCENKFHTILGEVAGHIYFCIYIPNISILHSDIVTSTNRRFIIYYKTIKSR